MPNPKGFIPRKIVLVARCWWLTPVIVDIWEAEIGRITVQDQPRQIVPKTPSPK
jgi:hypothetical protein